MLAKCARLLSGDRGSHKREQSLPYANMLNGFFIQFGQIAEYIVI